MFSTLQVQQGGPLAPTSFLPFWSLLLLAPRLSGANTLGVVPTPHPARGPFCFVSRPASLSPERKRQRLQQRRRVISSFLNNSDDDSKGDNTVDDFGPDTWIGESSDESLKSSSSSSSFLFDSLSNTDSDDNDDKTDKLSEKQIADTTFGKDKKSSNDDDDDADVPLPFSESQVRAMNRRLFSTRRTVSSSSLSSSASQDRGDGDFWEDPFDDDPRRGSGSGSRRRRESIFSPSSSPEEAPLSGNDRFREEFEFMNRRASQSLVVPTVLAAISLVTFLAVGLTGGITDGSDRFGDYVDSTDMWQDATPPAGVVEESNDSVWL